MVVKKAKTPQTPPRGQNGRQNTPRSAAAGNRRAVKVSEAIGTVRVGDAGMPDTVSATPKAAVEALAKRLNTPASPKKPITPANPKGKQLTPAAQGQKTGQNKTPASSSNRGGKRRAPVKQESDDEEEEQEDDEEQDEEEDVENEEDMDDDSEEEEDDDDSDEGGEDAILKKIRELRDVSKKGKGQQKSAVQSKVQNKEQTETAKKTGKQPLTPKKAKEEKPQEPPKAAESANRDKCTLFVKNLPPTVTVSDVKALSKDIKEVRLRITVRAKRRENKRRGFAFLEFSSEAVAEKNYKELQGAKLKDCDLVVDYVGQKSKNAPAKAKEEAADPDPLRLYITGFGSDLHEGDLNKLFPKARQISMPRRKKDKTAYGYAFAAFATEQQCKTALEKSQELTIKGHKLVVLPAKKRPQTSKKDKDSDKKIEPPMKKAKTTKGKHGGDDEEDDDDDEEEDDDEDDDSDDEENGTLDDDDEEEEEEDEEEDDDDDEEDEEDD